MKTNEQTCFSHCMWKIIRSNKIEQKMWGTENSVQLTVDVIVAHKAKSKHLLCCIQ